MATKIKDNEKVFDLIGLLKTIKHTFEINIKSENIEFELFIDPKVSNSYFGNNLLLHQVLNNIVGNAQKFTNSGLIGIKVKHLKQENELTWLQFEIYDTGIGISQENLSIIFDNFTQLNNNGNKTIEGTGLGFVKEIILFLGGEISATSRLNEGTEFTFTFPVKPVSEKNLTNSKINKLDKSSIIFLIVEDDLLNIKYISTLFDNNNIKYDIAYDGIEAIEKCKIKKYNLILMDIQMPRKSGIDATIFIRNNQNPNKDTIIIALTAFALVSQKEEALKAGMNDFISKPFSPKDLFQAIYMYFNFDEQDETSNSEIENREIIDELFHFDKEKFIYNNDNDISFCRDILSIFWSEENLISHYELENLLNSKNDLQKINSLIHKIKPSFNMVGLFNFYDKLNSLYIEGIQNYQSDENLDKIKDLIKEFLKNKDMIKKEMQNI